MTEKINNRLRPLPDGTSAALDFVKSICHVLGLDPALQDSVNVLKSNLLRLIGTVRLCRGIQDVILNGGKFF